MSDDDDLRDETRRRHKTPRTTAAAVSPSHHIHAEFRTMPVNTAAFRCAGSGLVEADVPNCGGHEPQRSSVAWARSAVPMPV
jgi:hypothetical protein